MSHTNRSIAVLGDIDAELAAAAREAAAHVSAEVVVYGGDDLPELENAPAMIMASMRSGRAFEACAKVRSDARFAGIPFVAIGNPRNPLSFTELFHSGGDDIVAPADATALTRRLRALCSRPAPRESAPPGVDTHAVVAGPSATWRLIIARSLANAGVLSRFASTTDEAIEASRGAKVVVAAHDLGPNGAESAIAAARSSGSVTPWVVVAPPKQMAALAHAVSPYSRVAVVDAFAPPENALFVGNELASASATDNRASPRLLFGAAVAFRSAGREDDDDFGYTYNVSAGGLFLRTLAPLEAGEEVWLELSAPRSSRRVRLAGTVVWRRHFGPSDSATVPAGFAVRIDEGLGKDLERWRDGCELLAQDELRGRPPRMSPRPPQASFVPSVLARATV